MLLVSPFNMCTLQWGFKIYLQYCNIFIVWQATLLRPGHAAVQGWSVASGKVWFNFSPFFLSEWAVKMAAALDTCTKQEQHATGVKCVELIWCPQLLEHNQCFVCLWMWKGMPTCMHQQHRFGCCWTFWSTHLNVTTENSPAHIGQPVISGFLFPNGLQLNQTHNMPPSNFELHYSNCMDTVLILTCT